MDEWALPVPIVLHLDGAARDRLGLPPGPLGLRRVWPRSGGHLPLEYGAADGRAVAGQWFPDRDELERAARETAQRSAAPSAVVADTTILLQPRGADRRLVALAPLVARPGAALLVHRAERSAVVRLHAADETRYVKVVRTKLVQAIAAKVRAAQLLAGSAFTTPQLLEVDVASGVIVSSGLDGVRIDELFGTVRLVPAMRAVGEALRALHETPPPDGLGLHEAARGIEGLKVYLERLAVYVPVLHDSLCLVAPAVFGALAAASSPTVLLHGDFSDKQVVVDPAGRVGMVDFDTLVTGEAAHDVANAMVKMEVRAMRGLCTPSDAERAIAAFLDGYRPSLKVQSRLNAFADAARLRLACLNAFRPAYAQHVPALLLDRIGAGHGVGSTTSHVSVARVRLARPEEIPFGA